MTAIERLENKISRLSNLKEDPVFTAVIAHCSQRYDVSEGDIFGTSRKRNFVRARHMVIYLLRHYYKMGVEELGYRLGGRDHTTIVTAYANVKHQAKIYPDLREDISIGEEFMSTLIKGTQILKTLNN